MKFGLVGKKLGHSFSQKYFTNKFNEEGIDASYQNFELEYIEDLANLFRIEDLKGFNVTIPYKQSIISYLDYIYAAISSLNAINTVKLVKEGNKIVKYGFNTDVYGFYHSLKPLLKSYHKKALILGTGGAAHAVAFVLEKLDINFQFVSRNSQKGLLYSEIDENLMSEYFLFVKTSPLGQFPNSNEKPELPYNRVTSKHLFYDLVYNPNETLFLKEAFKRGANIKNGLEMLHLQAEKAWEIFNTKELSQIKLF